MARDVARIPEVSDPDPETLGPAMRACTLPQRRFVIAYVEEPLLNGRGNALGAARLAGYGSTTAGRDLMRNPKVLDAIEECARQRLRGGALLGASVLVDIAGDTTAKGSDRIKAATELLDRAGIITETKHHVVVEDNRTEAELVAFIKAKAKLAGVDPALFLGHDAVDGDFVEVASDDFTVKPGEFGGEAEHPEGRNDPAA